MHSFLKGVRRTGNLSTNRNPAKTLALVGQQSLADTPANGMPAIPQTLRPEVTEEARKTRPLATQAIAPQTPLAPAGASSYSHTGPLQHPLVPSSEHAPSTGPVPAQVIEGARVMAQQGVNAAFKALSWATDQKIMSQIERRDRVVFLLLDGRRSIHDIARLVHREELDVARTLMHLLKSGYIEPVDALQ